VAADIIDVAVTSDRLLALSEESRESFAHDDLGELLSKYSIKEYSLDAKLVTIWKPGHSGYSKYMKMKAISALGDGRVAIVVEFNPSVLLLRRNAKTSAWEKFVELPQLDFSPKGIASRNLSFIVYGETDPYMPHSHAVIVNLLGKKPIFTKIEKDHRICGVSLTDKLVIDAAYFVTETRKAVVDAYLVENGQQLWQWRADADAIVDDVMTDDRAVYAILAYKNSLWKIAALSLKSGVFMRIVAAVETFLQHIPLKVALIGDEERPMLVFLEEKYCSSSVVTLHPSRGFVFFQKDF